MLAGNVMVARCKQIQNGGNFGWLPQVLKLKVYKLLCWLYNFNDDTGGNHTKCLLLFLRLNLLSLKHKSATGAW